MAALLLLASILVAWCCYNACRLLINYRRASCLNIPIVCVPVSPDSPLWIALQTAFSSGFKYIPFDAFSFTRHCRLGWEFHDRYKTHQRLGDVWMLVTPDRNWLFIAQAEAAYEVFSRGRDFGRPVWMLSELSMVCHPRITADLMTDALNVFGPNVSTVRTPFIFPSTLCSFEFLGRRSRLAATEEADGFSIQ